MFVNFGTTNFRCINFRCVNLICIKFRYINLLKQKSNIMSTRKSCGEGLQRSIADFRGGGGGTCYISSAAADDVVDTSSYVSCGSSRVREGRRRSLGKEQKPVVALGRRSALRFSFSSYLFYFSLISWSLGESCFRCKVQIVQIQQTLEYGCEFSLK